MCGKKLMYDHVVIIPEIKMVEKTDMDDMIKMLADAPEEQRKTMIIERFKMIGSQPEEQRVQSVKGILLAVAKLDPKKKQDFIRTRTNAMLELPQDTRKAIQVARVKAGGQVPEEVNQSDMMGILQTCMAWPKERHKMFMDNLGAVFKDLGMQMPDVESMMQMMAKTSEEMKKPWWKFW